MVVRYEAGPESVPYCETCHQTPNLEEIARAQAAEAGCVSVQKPSIGVDNGSMNLWWPRSVPYAEGPDFDGSVSNDRTVPDISSAQSEKTSKDAWYSTVYTSELGAESLRLVCLTAINNENLPVHVDLEIYRLDNCPSYEAVSYTWGGEDDDSTCSRPVYVGPYWDVTMQTKNCWEMLRFVRPQRRGFRLVWVDALCINQRNLTERSLQVSNMKHIYSAAMQVLVYLGPDVASQLPPGTYPRRRRLNELSTAKTKLRAEPDSIIETARGGSVDMTWQELLGRRYFSRLWVVQEVLLSYRTTIRIGNVDFWTDGMSFSLWKEESPRQRRDAWRLSEEATDDEAGGTDSETGTDDVTWGTDSNWNPEAAWRKTAAPWLLHASKGAQLKMTLPELMAMTSSTHCSDPRDRLFGVLGLLNPAGNHAALRADYSVSQQHVYIGLFAHLLLNHHLWAVLDFSTPELDCDASPHRPSWMPNWTSRELMSELWISVAATDKRLIFSEVESEVSRDFGKGDIISIAFANEAYIKRNDDGAPDPLTNLSIDRRDGAIAGDMVRLMTIRSQPKLMYELRDSVDLPLRCPAKRALFSSSACIGLTSLSSPTTTTSIWLIKFVSMSCGRAT